MDCAPCSSTLGGTIVVIGATGAQGGGVVRTLSRAFEALVAFYLLPATSLRDLSGEPWNSMGLAAAYGRFLPAVYHPFVLREAG